MNYDELRNYYIERIISSGRVIPSIELLKQDGEWYGRRDLNKSGFDGFDLSYFMLGYLISQNINLEMLLNNKEQLEKIELTLIPNTINYYNNYFKTDEIKHNFEEVSTPNELMDYMNKEIKYGWTDEKGIKYLETLKGAREGYRIKSVEEVITSKVGTCIDQANIQKKFLDRIGLENKIYCIEYKENENSDKLKIHPITVYKENDKWYHFEHAFYNYRGIHEFDNLEDTINAFLNNCFANANIVDVKEIDILPESLSIDNFIKYVDSFQSIKEKDNKKVN